MPACAPWSCGLRQRSLSIKVFKSTPDKPDVTLRPPTDPNTVSSFLNIRVADIHTVYEQWRARGAEFLTPPTDRRHELRCYMRDPDGHLIEVGQRIPG